MIGALKGTAYVIKKNPVIFFAGDVGYNVHITDRLAKTLIPNKTTLLFIHTHVREDALDLYGFISQEELTFFELLLTVPGIGPKTALLVLNLGTTAIQKAIQTSDVDFFTGIPRLGKKNAQKIIIELKNKLGSIKDLDLRDESLSETKQLTDALLSMGFVRDEIREVVKKLPEKSTSLEEKLRDALKLLGHRQ